MAIGAFPAAKLLTLLIRQISKPIANYAKEKAKTSPFFRTYICMPPGQFYNFCEVKTKMWLLNLGKPVNVPALNEAMAIELGANLLGEGIIFVVGAAVLIGEYTRQVKKESAKEEFRKMEMESLNHTIQELFFQISKQDTQIKELTRTIYDMDASRKWLTWKKKDSENPPSEPPSSSGGGGFSIIPTSPKVIEPKKSTTVLPDRQKSVENVIERALDFIENELFYSEEITDDNIIMKGLQHLYNNKVFLYSSY